MSDVVRKVIALSILIIGAGLLWAGRRSYTDAADAKNGAVLWTYNGSGVPRTGGANAAPVAYVAGGREFIVNAFGGNLADRAAFPPNPVGDAIIAFGLPSP